MIRRSLVDLALSGEGFDFVEMSRDAGNGRQSGAAGNLTGDAAKETLPVFNFHNTLQTAEHGARSGVGLSRTALEIDAAQEIEQ